jgi:hypothetical protein
VVDEPHGHSVRGGSNALGIGPEEETRMKPLAMFMLLMLAGLSAFAQVTGGQAPPEEQKTVAPPAQPVDVEVPCPLLVQVSLLPTKPGGRTLLVLPTDGTQTFRTRQYVCDKARVEYVQLLKRKASHDKIRVAITAGLSTGWFAQRVTMTLGLYDGERQLKTETWKLRIGRDNMFVAGSSSSKTGKIEVELSQQELDDLFAEGHAPTVKVLVAINDD